MLQVNRAAQVQLGSGPIELAILHESGADLNMVSEEVIHVELFMLTQCLSTASTTIWSESRGQSANNLDCPRPETLALVGD